MPDTWTNQNVVGQDAKLATKSKTRSITRSRMLSVSEIKRNAQEAVFLSFFEWLLYLQEMGVKLTHFILMNLMNAVSLPEAVRNKIDYEPLFCAEEDLPKISQDRSESEMKERKEKIDELKCQYQWDYGSLVAPAPVVDNLPDRERPPVAGSWTQKVVHRVIQIFGSRVNEASALSFLTALKDHDLGRLFEILQPIPDEFDERPESLESAVRDVAEREIPGETIYTDTELGCDEAYVRYRLAGPNPLALEKCTQDVLDKMCMGDKTFLSEYCDMLLKEDRLFCVDYEQLRKLNFRAGVNHDGKKAYKKYPAYPIALFELPDANIKDQREIGERQGLIPVAIQCQPGHSSSIFTPNDADRIGWETAKTVLNSTDGDYHEGVAHLAETHMVMEVFAIATNRSLQAGHPIWELLSPHLTGTININFLAVRDLISPGKIVDLLVSQDIRDINRVVGVTTLAKISKDFSFPAMLKERKIDAENFPVLNFPYREDGQLIWDAILEFVTSYVDVYYADSDAIANDVELQGWVNELKDSKESINGEVVTHQRCAWMNSFDNSKEMLSKVLASIIFTGSAQHAAVNFPQRGIMGGSVVFPLALYDSVPLNEEQATEQRQLDSLPPMQMLNFQRDVANLLGGVHYTKLTSYEGHFKDSKVEDAVTKFEESMAAAKDTIDGRNNKREDNWKYSSLKKELHSHWRYHTLLPDMIPQSINI